MFRKILQHVIVEFISIIYSHSHRVVVPCTSLSCSWGGSSILFITNNVATLTSGLWLSVECKGQWGRVFLGVKHIITNGGDCKKWSLMTPSALPLWELHLCVNLKCSKPWLKRQTSTKLGPQDTIGKVLKFKCLTFPCIVHWDLIYMNYDQKKGRESNWEFDSWPQIPLE